MTRKNSAASGRRGKPPVATEAIPVTCGIKTPSRDHSTGDLRAAGNSRLPAYPTAMAELRAARYVRPFALWPVIRDGNPNHLEVRRFCALPAHLQDSSWLARRRHAPCDLEVPPHWDLDVLYFRTPEEEPYARRLGDLRPPVGALGPQLSPDYLAFSAPFIPYRWPTPQTPCVADFKSFSPRGDLPDPSGGEVALDSAWALREGSMAADCGDPGRLLAEIWKEGRDLVRPYNEFVPYHMVEFYRQSPPTRHELYANIPSWWGEVWVSHQMFVPLPPVLTYRARAFLPESTGTPEWRFFQLVLEAEWTALVFSRWCTDIPHRGIMWALGPRLRQRVNELGLSTLLRGSSYTRGDVVEWLRDHDRYDWSARTMFYQERGGNQGEPPRIRRLVEFVREYPRYRVTLRRELAVPRGTWADVPGEPTQVGMSDRPTLEGDPLANALTRYANDPYPSADPATEVRQLLLMQAGWDPYGDVEMEGEVDPYAPVRPRLRSAPATVVTERFPPATPSPERVSPLTWDVQEAAPSLLRKLGEARLMDCMQYYARIDLQQEDARGMVSVREEAIVLCISSLYRAYQENRAQMWEMRGSLERLHDQLRLSEERIRVAEVRARKAEERSDLVLRAYSATGGEPLPKRRRPGDG